MKTITRKLKQVASGIGIASLFLVAGMAMGGPVMVPMSGNDAVQSVAKTCVPENALATPEAQPPVATTKAAASRAMRMPYFSFGNLLPRASVLSNVISARP